MILVNRDGTPIRAITRRWPAPASDGDAHACQN